jgi:hypothetical protein
MIIIFNGPPGSGKDEASAFLSINHGFKSISFKEQLFKETVKYFDVSLEWFMENYNDRIIKETKVPELDNLSRREALIYVSEEVIKPKYGNRHFGSCAADQIDQVSSYCFSDGGFVDEIYPLIDTVGANAMCIVQLYRHECSYIGDSRGYVDGVLQEEYILGSKSEMSTQEVSHLPIRMYQIHNNATISNFHQSIRSIVWAEIQVIHSHTSKFYG